MVIPAKHVCIILLSSAKKCYTKTPIISEIFYSHNLLKLANFNQCFKINLRFKYWLKANCRFWVVWTILWILKIRFISNYITHDIVVLRKWQWSYITLSFLVKCKSDKSVCGKAQPYGYPASFCKKFRQVYFTTRMHSLRMRTSRSLPYRKGFPDRDLPWTKTPWTETLLDRNAMDRDPSGQRPSLTEAPGQRPA